MLGDGRGGGRKTIPTGRTLYNFPTIEKIVRQIHPPSYEYRFKKNQSPLPQGPGEVEVFDKQMAWGGGGV